MSEVKKVSATLVPQPETTSRPFSHVDLYLGGMNTPPANHPLAAARQALADAEEKFRAAAFEFQRELQTSVKLAKAEPGAWCCGKLNCEGRMEMRDGNLYCAVCGRTCSPGDSQLRWRAYPAQTTFSDADAPARIRAARKRMEKLELARDEARRTLSEGAGELNSELAAESRAQRHKQ